MFDRYDTPEKLALYMAEAVGSPPNSVLDPCVGGGSLLGATVSVFPRVEVFGTDLDPCAIRGLRHDHPSWKLGRADFLSSRSRNASPVLRNRKFEAVLVNPPFSQRGGGARHRVTVEGNEVGASKAMTFVMESAAYLSDTGCLVALVPSGVTDSARDSELLNYLQPRLDILASFPRGAFQGCTADLTVLRLTGSPVSRSQRSKVAATPSARFSLPAESQLVRGTLAMHRAVASAGGIPLVHTINLRANRLIRSTTIVDPSHSTIQGPAVLIPRVGRPDVSKLAVIPDRRTYALSDCVYAVTVNTAQQARDLQSALIADWKALEAAYIGSCARHLTKARLTVLLGLC